MGFFYTSPAKKALPYLDQIQSNAQQSYQPYQTQGLEAFNQVGQQYQNLAQNPAAFMQDLGSTYQQSPGFNYALQQALAASNQAAAAGGMAGSPQAQTEAMEIATGLSNQDYMNYLSNLSNFYGMGLQGLERQAGYGMDATNRLNDISSSVLSQRSSNAYQKAADENAMKQMLMQLALKTGLYAAGVPGGGGF